MKMGLATPSYNVEYQINPAQDTLRDLAIKHAPCMVKTAYDNLDKITRLKARLAAKTYIIGPASEASKWSGKTIERDRAEKLIAHQKKYIEDSGHLIQVDGYQGLAEHAIPVQWLFTLDASNLAAMQQTLSFPRSGVETEEQMKQPHKPYFRVVMTPGCNAPGMDGEIAMIVDLDNWTTYVIGSDYFGESKKGMLRMLNHYVYLQGGLVMHAGCKEITVGGERIAMGILGLSGTGKTTTTFSKQGELTRPIQDDMIAIWPEGEISITENGCFAKTWDLIEEAEPTIYHGTVDPSAWLENVYFNADGTFDFAKSGLSIDDVKRLKDILIATGASEANVDKYINGEVKFDDVVDENGIAKDGWDFVVWSQNGRSIIPMKAIEGAADLTNIPRLRSLGILNRDEGRDAAMPGIIRFTSPLRAAAYFMLGETSKTSAAGKERGKTRSPFTQPFFPLSFGLMSSRFGELVKKLPGLTTWLMNTGYVGGDENDRQAGKAFKVKIKHSSAMLEAMIRDEIVWKTDPDFGYEIVDVDAPENAKLLEKVPVEILNPKVFYEKEGRMDEYNAWVVDMKNGRAEFLKKYDVPQEIQDQL
ncbi:phosphoenolpyruvate carboxykinase (ATP) [bacterium]|nr:phosphoenolpyruvate carboxykinase (ATP) [bacterium]